MTERHPNIIELLKVIQGEGYYAGTPSLLIRFSGCNILCAVCDSVFSHTETPKLDIHDALKFINENPTHDIIITGGEPMLHQHDIGRIIDAASSNVKITVETNGTIYPDQLIFKRFLIPKALLWSVSPKFDTFKLDVIKRFSFENSNVQFKFVISDLENDIEAIRHLIDKRYISITHLPVFVQPDNTGLNSDKYIKACRNLADYLIDNNLNDFRIMPQLHILFWGHERGK